MNVNPTETQADIVGLFSKWFENECPSEVVRAAEPLGHDERLWSSFADLGGIAIGLPEDLGGGGMGLVEWALIAEQLGRTVAPIPILDAAVAARVLAQHGADATTWIDRIRDDRVIVTFAPRPSVDGVFRLVPTGRVADAVVGLHDGALVLLPLASGETRDGPKNLGDQPMADCPVTDSAIVLERGDAAGRAFDQARDEGKALVAAAVVGMAARAHEIALDYIKVRKAFGTTLASFQTVAHRMAADIVNIDGARFLAYEAAWTLDEGLSNAAPFASAALAYCSEMAYECTATALHVHGGVGYTEEADIQLFYRRATAWPLAFGDPRREYRRIGDLLWRADEVA